MKTELTVLSPETISSLVLNGDLGKLTPMQKVEYYNALCKRIGLDPATQPFKLLNLQGKQILYADKGATQQLSQIHSISHEITKKEVINDVYIVTVRAKTGDRFTDEDGAVSIGGLKGNDLANATMKCVTKAKRRAVLALCGLGMLDESEIETIKGAQIVDEANIRPVVSMPKALEAPKQAAEPKTIEMLDEDDIEVLEANRDFSEAIQKPASKDLIAKTEALAQKVFNKSKKAFREWLLYEYSVDQLSALNSKSLEEAGAELYKMSKDQK